MTITQAVPSLVEATRKIAESEFGKATLVWSEKIKDAREKNTPLPTFEEINADLQKHTTDPIAAREQARKILRVRTEWKEVV